MYTKFSGHFETVLFDVELVPAQGQRSQSEFIEKVLSLSTTGCRNQDARSKRTSLFRAEYLLPVRFIWVKFVADKSSASAVLSFISEPLAAISKSITPRCTLCQTGNIDCKAQTLHIVVTRLKDVRGRTGCHKEEANHLETGFYVVVLTTHFFCLPHLYL